MNEYCVYAHINKINGRVYVGQTKQSLNSRWRNGEGYIGNEHFYRAIKKYGWDSFEHIIIRDNLTLEEANILESEKIKEYKSLTHENGYNILYGGNNKELPKEVRNKIAKAHTGTTHICSEETKRKIGQANKGRKFSDEQRKNMSNGQKGKKYSADTIRKHSEQLKKEWALGIRKSNGLPSPNRKSIIATNIETNEKTKFEYVSLAAKQLDIPRTAISSVLSGRQRKTHGYYFEEVKDE